MKDSFAGDFQKDLVPSLDGLRIIIGRQTLLRVPSLESGMLARGAIAELIGEQFLTLRTYEKIDEQQRRVGMLAVREDSDAPRIHWD